MKKYLSLLMAAILMAGYWSCDDEEKTVAVTGVTVNPKTVSIVAGTSATVTVTVQPEDAANKNVSWKSNATAIATVNNGVITGVTPGTATVTVTAEDGGHTATVAVTVTEDVVHVTGVTVEPSTLSVEEGALATVTATVLPANATNPALIWASNAPDIATVDNGVIRGVVSGAATITVATVDGGKTASVAVTVTAIPMSVTGVSVEPTAVSIVRDATATIVATVSPANAANKAVTWASNATGIATVADGVITGVAVGVATITVTTEEGGYTATVAVTVTEKPITVEKLWTKTAAEIGLTNSSENSIAVCGDYLVLSRTGICINKADGSLAGKTLNITGIPGATPAAFYVTNDSKGNMIGATLPTWAGVFNIYKWTSVDADPILLYSSSTGTVAGAGRKLSVVGDINGHAFIYDQAGGNDTGTHNQWEVVGGVLQTPTTFNTGVPTNDGNWYQTLGPLEVTANPSFFLVDATSKGANVQYRDGNGLREMQPSVFRKIFGAEWIDWLHESNEWGNYSTTGCTAFWFKEKAYGATLSQSWPMSLFTIIDAATPDYNYYYEERTPTSGLSTINGNATAGACHEVAPDGNTARVYALFTGESVSGYEMKIPD
jgi:uncharacterized protein YjdB